jgi:type IV secretory pathway VirD2 relaxase
VLDAYNNRDDIVKEVIDKQQTVNCHIDACKETRQKYCLLEAQIEEEEKQFQRCIGSVRESLLQLVEPNIKKIEDQCRAGDEILKLQEKSPEYARQSQKFPLIYLAQLSRYRNGLNAFEKQYMNCNILADLRITQSREDVHQVFLSKVV